jgi:tetratricopeptide (TPR) repeat protein
MRSRILLALVLVMAIACVYSQVTSFGFLTYDDNEYVTANPHVNTGLSLPNIVWAFTHSHSSNWHPLTWISHMADVTMFTMDRPGMHHVVNVVFHALNALLLFLFLASATGNVWRSAFVAGLFALHPLHVESVAWVAERKDVLSTFFLMLTLLAYARYVKKPGTARYGLVALCFALGLMAKPMLVTLPMLLLALDLWPFGRTNLGWRRLTLEKLPLFALSIASSIATFFAQRAGGSVNTLDAISLPMRLANAAATYATYLFRTIWPVDLIAHYPYPAHIVALPIVAGIAVLAGLTFLALKTRQTNPYVAAGWAWYVVSLLPVIGIVQVGSQASADRYTYIPLFGVFFALAWGVSEAPFFHQGSKAKKHTHSVPLGIAAVLCLTLLSALSYVQVGYWKDKLTLFSHAVGVAPGSPVALYHLGGAYGDAGHHDKAIECYDKALAIAPGYGIARKHRADCLAQAGRSGEAIEGYREALAQAPDSPMAHNNLANELYESGQIEEALDHWQKALEIDPNCAEAHASLGRALADLGKTDQSLQHCNKAVELNPRSADAHNNLGMVLGQKGDISGAREHFREAAKLNPKMAQARFNLGILAAGTGDLDEAVTSYQEALSLDPNLAGAHERLAEVFFRKGDYAQAWAEVHQLEALGRGIDPKFVEALSAKMPDPGR